MEASTKPRIRFPQPERTTIAGGKIEIPRIINGLWQLAGGHDTQLHVPQVLTSMHHLIAKGFDAFDMADHYGDAELIVGELHKQQKRPTTAFTKWCPPEDSKISFEKAEQAVSLALSRMAQDRIELMQYHIWDYSDPTYIHNMHHLRVLQRRGKIGSIGMTNTDAAHLQLLLDTGFSIATNQVACNVLDRRITHGRLQELCLKHDVGLLCYGSLLGGFLSDKWVDRPEPAIGNLNWSLRKYLRFIWAAGGWEKYQIVLRALKTIAQRHTVPITAVATRYVLDIPSVKAVIVGTRLGPNSAQYADENLRAFTFELSDEDRELIAEAQEGLEDLPGDCGDEYRRPPYLTAAGDLSHHLLETGNSPRIHEAVAKGKRIEYCTGSKWEVNAGCCRAVRSGNTIHISSTTANSPIPDLYPNIGGLSAASQTVRILDIIEQALKALGSSFSDIVRTRILVQDRGYADEVSRAHAWRTKCAGIQPASALYLAGLVDEVMLVEIEAWAEVGSGAHGVLRVGEERADD